MEKKVINYLINQYNNAFNNIVDLEQACQEAKITNDKEKANFGNMCVALRGYRMVTDAVEAILINEDILKDEENKFYQKIQLDEETDEEPEKEDE